MKNLPAISTGIILVMLLVANRSDAFQVVRQKSATATQTVAANPKPEAPLIPIEQIVEAVHGNDTVKLGQVIGIKLKTDNYLKPLDILLVNGFKANLVRSDTSHYEKIIYYRVNTALLDVLERFQEGSGLSRTTIPIQLALTSSASGAKKPLTTSGTFFLEVKPKVSNHYVFITICVGILAMIVLALWKNVLKDDNNLYYSLGRTQLFYWTVIFITGYLYIWYRTDILPDVSDSMLIILGISIGTTALGKVVENTVKPITPIDSHARSEGWFIDILSDSSSINIQRFQNVLFNFVFGCIFLQRCVTTHALPEFDSNILLLMGISSSTYAGLKVTEPVKEQKSALPVTGDDSANSKGNESVTPSPDVAVG